MSGARERHVPSLPVDEFSAEKWSRGSARERHLRALRRVPRDRRAGRVHPSAEIARKLRVKPLARYPNTALIRRRVGKPPESQGRPAAQSRKFELNGVAWADGPQRGPHHSLRPNRSNDLRLDLAGLERQPFREVAGQGIKDDPRRCGESVNAICEHASLLHVSMLLRSDARCANRHAMPVSDRYRPPGGQTCLVPFWRSHRARSSGPPGGSHIPRTRAIGRLLDSTSTLRPQTGHCQVSCPGPRLDC